MIEASQLRSVILDIQRQKNAVGSFFSARNQTAKGERSWLCRFGAHSMDRGGSMPYDALEKNLLTVWDKFAYEEEKKRGRGGSPKRNINVNTLTYLRVCGIVLIRDGRPTLEFQKRMLN